MTTRLPEQQYFSLEDVAKAWEGVDVDYVIEQIMGERLTPSVRLGSMTGEWWDVTEDHVSPNSTSGLGVTGTRVTEDVSTHVPGSVWYLPQISTALLGPDEQGDYLVDINRSFLTDDPTPPDPENPRRWFRPIPEMAPSSEWLSPLQPKQLSRKVRVQDLLLSRGVRDDFYASGLTSEAIKGAAKTENNTLKKMVGLLALILVRERQQAKENDSTGVSEVGDASSSGQKTGGDGPRDLGSLVNVNISNVAKDILDEIALHPEIAQYGLTFKNLERQLPIAIKMARGQKT